ncbi:hypothetical protein [Streptomyces sp. cg35]|uniref:hypothetical protein n=1 Tax=Streptomyces sp. cg35 TaxID=3421650 RepID=UPI003D17FA8E
MERSHLYLPLVDSSGEAYPYAEVTLLDPDTNKAIEEPVYLDPNGGAPQSWPVLIDPAVINLWTDRPLRVTVLAALPGGASFTRAGVDVLPPPSATVRSQKPLRIGSAQGLSGNAMLAVSPNGTAIWQVLDALRFHRHEGDAPYSTVLAPSSSGDIYPGQTWIGKAIGGTQGSGATALGAGAQVNGPGATALGRATASTDGVALGATAAAGASALAAGAGANATAAEQVALGRNASAAAAASKAIVLGGGRTAAADQVIRLGDHVSVRADGTVIIGQGDVPTEWVSGGPFIALLGNVVAGRYVSARGDAMLAGATSALGFFGSAGATQQFMSKAAITASTPGREALLSLLTALDTLGLVYLTDSAIDDELADFSKSSAHDANLVLETGDTDGAMGGDTTRVKRNAAGTASITYQQASGVRDFRARVFNWIPSGVPDMAALRTEVVADVSATGTTWTRIPLAFPQPTATANAWFQSWVGNALPIPAGNRYLRLTLGVNASVFSPQIGRIVIRPRA